MEITHRKESCCALAFGCAVECRRNWVNAAMLLYRSVLLNGGDYRESPFNMFVATDNAHKEECFKHGNLTVTFVPRIHEMPYLHKCSILARIERGSSQHTLLLDHDVVVRSLDGISTFFDSGLCARMNNKDSLYLLIGQDYAVSLAGMSNCSWESLPYFNAGVVLCPDGICSTLYNWWTEYTQKLYSIYANPLAEQVALSLAVGRLRCFWKYLPTQYNQTNWGELLPDAKIIHYNDFNQANRYVKRIVLEHYSRLEEYLTTTENRFWLTYRRDVLGLLSTELEELSSAVWAFCERYS